MSETSAPFHVFPKTRPEGQVQLSQGEHVFFTGPPPQKGFARNFMKCLEEPDSGKDCEFGKPLKI